MLIQDQGFPRGERVQRGCEDGAVYYDEVSLKEPQFICKSVAVRWTICMNANWQYGQLSPRICYVYIYACLLTLAYSRARYLSKSNFSRIVYSWYYR